MSQLGGSRLRRADRPRVWKKLRLKGQETLSPEAARTSSHTLPAPRTAASVTGPAEGCGKLSSVHQPVSRSSLRTSKAKSLDCYSAEGASGLTGARRTFLKQEATFTTKQVSPEQRCVRSRRPWGSRRLPHQSTGRVKGTSQNGFWSFSTFPPTQSSLTLPGSYARPCVRLCTHPRDFPPPPAPRGAQLSAEAGHPQAAWAGSRAAFPGPSRPPRTGCTSRIGGLKASPGC